MATWAWGPRMDMAPCDQDACFRLWAPHKATISCCCIWNSLKVTWVNPSLITVTVVHGPQKYPAPGDTGSCNPWIDVGKTQRSVAERRVVDLEMVPTDWGPKRTISDGFFYGIRSDDTVNYQCGPKLGSHLAINCSWLLHNPIQIVIFHDWLGRSASRSTWEGRFRGTDFLFEQVGSGELVAAEDQIRFQKNQRPYYLRPRVKRISQ